MNLQDYALESVDECVLCGSAASKVAFSVGAFGYRRCESCRLVRLSPRLSQSELNKFYESTYSTPYAGNPTPMEEQLANPTFAYRARRLEAATSGRRLFEIGCGDGNFLAVMRRRGWAVRGGDVTRAGAKAAHDRHDLPVDVIDFDAIAIPPCDAVGAYHVLEHIYDPRAFLKNLRAQLAVGAVLHIQMPNLRSVDGRLGGANWWGLQCPQHVYFFEPRHLEKMLAEEGFRARSVETFDPWHSPGTVENTVRSALRWLAPKRPASTESRATESGAGGAHAVGVAPGATRSRAMLRAAGKVLRLASRSMARAESLVGWGNILDVVAVAV
jgi:SAM-dependent methyltransferase